MWKKSICVLVTLVFLSACQGGVNEEPPTPVEQPTQTPTEIPLPTASATDSAPTKPPIKTEQIEVTYEDPPYPDTVLRGTLMGEGDVAVILAPMALSNRVPWLPFARHIAELGYTALAFDWPNDFGASKGRFSFSKTKFDTAAIVDYLQIELGYEKIVCIGGSIGGVACIEVPLLRPGSLAGVVSVSTDNKLVDRMTPEEIATLTMPKLMIVENLPDFITALNSNLAVLPPPKEKKIFDHPAHGTDIFNSPNKDELRDLLVSFLEGIREN